MLDAKNPAPQPHILNISPPLNMHPLWFSPHVAYTMAKLVNCWQCALIEYLICRYGMSMCVLGMYKEFDGKIAVNALWPKTGEKRGRV